MSKNGPRFDPSFPPEKLSEPENLLLLCYPHHKKIDKKENEREFTTPVVRKMKHDHESLAHSSFRNESSLAETFAQKFMASQIDHSAIVMGDSNTVVVSTGVSCTEAWKIAETVIQAKISELRAEARSIAEARRDKFNNQLFQNGRCRFEAFSSPDFQFQLIAAQNAAIRSGGLIEILVNLLARRSRASVDSLKAKVLNRAISVAGELTEKQCGALSVHLLISWLRQEFTSAEGLRSWLSERVSPTISGCAIGLPDATYLGSLGLVSQNSVKTSGQSLKSMLANAYPIELFGDPLRGRSVEMKLEAIIGAREALNRLDEYFIETENGKYLPKFRNSSEFFAHQGKGHQQVYEALVRHAVRDFDWPHFFRDANGLVKWWGDVGGTLSLNITGATLAYFNLPSVPRLSECYDPDLDLWSRD